MPNIHCIKCLMFYFRIYILEWKFIFELLNGSLQYKKNNSILLEVSTSVFTVSSYFPEKPRIFTDFKDEKSSFRTAESWRNLAET